MIASGTERPDRKSASSNEAWVRALQLTAPIAKSPERIFPTVVEELAERFGEAPALLSDRECLTYRGLAKRSNQYARWALDQGIAKGDTVCLFMPNRPEYMGIWLGITRVGGVVALINTNLTGPSLAHCIQAVAPKCIIADSVLVERLTTALPSSADAPAIWIHGEGDAAGPRLDQEVERYSGDTLTADENRPITINDRALYIFTSGTTGLPKAAHVSHGRIMQWSHWFAGMMDTRSTDRMYNCLPMYHSVGGVQALGAVLLGGGAVVLRDRFSASQFWTDITRWDCTLFQYIGELCRYLLHNEPSGQETTHRIRMACGNGLKPEVWSPFKNRFHIPYILEFYASTEGAVSLFNAEGEPGAIGRIPPFLAHRSPVVLVKFDVEKDEPMRNEEGFYSKCGPDEAGEAIGPLSSGMSHSGNRFEGYIGKEDSDKRILRDVFRQGDAWFRTGDLMRKDGRGFFYFVDRIGDTFRWKGENVAASEVSDAICAFPGVKQALVYGVRIPHADGRAGMAAIVPDGELDLQAFRANLISRLPKYACPLFLRVRNEMELTVTFKYTRTDFVRQGYSPLENDDVIYFNHPEDQAFVRLDQTLYERIENGEIRL